MLYLTTRDHKDAYTVHKTMLCDVASDGGAFVPMQIPVATDFLTDMKNRSFGENITQILNSYFSAHVNGWTVDFAIGRNCMKSTLLSQKIAVLETWHNPFRSYRYVAESLYKQLSDSREVAEQPTAWVMIAIKIAVIFAAYGDLLANDSLNETETFDIAVNIGDFLDPMAAWYAKNMGLPINMIICACDESDGIWDLVHRGQINTATIPDSLKSGIERLIYAVYGGEEANRFVELCEKRKQYTVDPETERNLNDLFFCAVLGRSRAENVINSLLRTDQYNVCADTALAYGAVSDYRAKTGENRTTLLFSDQDPT